MSAAQGFSGIFQLPRLWGQQLPLGGMQWLRGDMGTFFPAQTMAGASLSVSCPHRARQALLEHVALYPLWAGLGRLTCARGRRAWEWP